MTGPPLLRYGEQLIDKTLYPDRASAPKDEPLVEQLLAAGTRKRPSGAGLTLGGL
ncbi:hypothetical protein [Streptomyces sp. NPDC048560]|uniref:hypothetical protein n=1 Tax=Streptomyces sp. NPDC048560 TaxID=3155488 RepID=UPI003427D6F7